MSFAEKEPFPSKGIQIDVEVDDGTVFFAYCQDCKKVLYCATYVSPITKHVAEVSMQEHSQFFDYPHRALIIKTK